MSRSLRLWLCRCALVGVALPLVGCTGFRQAIGVAKVSPDEFAVVTKAPLVIPPDYSLKPPAPGAGPTSDSSELAAQRALIGDVNANTAGLTPGERALLGDAGAQYADPMIRQIIDQEYAGIVDKDRDFADRLIFWSHPNQAKAAELNAAQEARRLGETEPGAKPAVKPASDEGAAAEGGKTQAVAKTEARVPATGPDKVEGQKEPTIGERPHSRLLDGIF
jgi:hypothetical protein